MKLLFGVVKLLLILSDWLLPLSILNLYLKFHTLQPAHVVCRKNTMLPLVPRGFTHNMQLHPLQG